MEQIELSYTNRAVTTIFILGGLEVTIGGGLTMVEGEELNNFSTRNYWGAPAPLALPWLRHCTKEPARETEGQFAYPACLPCQVKCLIET